MVVNAIRDWPRTVLSGIIAPMKNLPFSFIVMEFLGLLCLVPAVASLAGFGALLHPILADSGAGIAALVTAVSLIISGFFPFVLRRLMVQEEQQDAARRRGG